MLAAGDSTGYENFIGMVFEDYELDKRVFDIQLSYMFAKKLLQKLPQDTPPVYVSNSRQFQVFLGQSKVDVLRLCVELKDKVDLKKTSKDELQKDEENCDNSDEEDEDYESRFDYCDDSDGTDSGDEDFAAYGFIHEEDHDDKEEEEKVKLSIKKRGSLVFLSEGNENVIENLE